MKRSSERILTTHVGSLPRSQAVTDVLFGREKGPLADEAAHQRDAGRIVQERDRNAALGQKIAVACEV